MEARGSRRKFAAFTRPSRVFIMISSPCSSYHMTVCCGEPSSLIVARTAKRFSARKARTSSDRFMASPNAFVVRMTHAPRTAIRTHLAASGPHLLDLWDDLRAQQLEGHRIRHRSHADDRLVEAQRRHMREPLDRARGRQRPSGAVTRDAHAVERGLLDLFVGPAQRLAVSAQHVELVGEDFVAHTREEVAGVAVLRDELQRFLLACAAYQYWRMWLRDDLRRVERASEMRMLPVEGLILP